MTIKSVDMQVLIPKVQEVGRIKQIQLNQGQENQQNFASQMQEQTEIRQRSVQQTPQGKGGKVNNKKESGQRRDKKKGHGKVDSKEEKKGEGNVFNEGAVGQHIDIKV